MELKGKKVNFLGDSITQGVGASSDETIYHQVMKRKYGLSEARNYGVSGSCFARQISPDYSMPRDHDFCERLHTMDDDADIVVVFGGTNDFGRGDAPIGSFADREPNTFYGACHYICSNLITKYPDAVIVFMTPCHRLRDTMTNGDSKNKAYNYGDLKSYVDIIRSVTEYYSIPVVDLYASSGIQPNIDVNRKKYMPDGLHPNDAGNALIAERLANFLLSY